MRPSDLDEELGEVDVTMQNIVQPSAKELNSEELLELQNLQHNLDQL